MTKIGLVNGTIINADEVKLVNGILKISTKEKTVEELAEIFSDKENTNLITLMTKSGIETGYKIGFTSFAGIIYDEEGLKTVELFQPIDSSEVRISSAEGAANKATKTATEVENTVDAILGMEV